MKEAEEGTRQVYFVDASHFIWAGFLGFLWCLERVFIPTPSGRQRFSVLGALNAKSKQVVPVFSEGSVDAWTVIQLMFEIRRHRDGSPISLILDNVRYQRCYLVQEAAKIMDINLIFLPTYSPNFNLIERFWKFVKKKCLYSKYYADFKSFKDAISNCVEQGHIEHEKELCSLLTLNFQLFCQEARIVA